MSREIGGRELRDGKGRTAVSRIVLASGSPRRKELLRLMGIRDFIIRTPGVDETMEGGLTPEETVRRLSAKKAAAEAPSAEPDEVIIAADTIVFLDGLRLGKPKDEADAARMLRLLSGREHQVYTGVTVRRGREKLTEAEMTRVWFRELREEEIRAYVLTGEPADKAGAYAAQGLGAVFIRGIEGDFFNVMGLPLCRLSGMLEQFGIKPFQMEESAGKVV